MGGGAETMGWRGCGTRRRHAAAGGTFVDERGDVGYEHPEHVLDLVGHLVVARAAVARAAGRVAEKKAVAGREGETAAVGTEEARMEEVMEAVTAEVVMAPRRQSPGR